MFSWLFGPQGRIKAKPNPVPNSREANAGKTTLHWSASGTGTVEVRLARPDGPLVFRGGPRGKITTGELEAEFTHYYLQNAEVRESLSLLATLGVVTVEAKGFRAAHDPLAQPNAAPILTHTDTELAPTDQPEESKASAAGASS